MKFVLTPAIFCFFFLCLLDGDYSKLYIRHWQHCTIMVIKYNIYCVGAVLNCLSGLFFVIGPLKWNL